MRKKVFGRHLSREKATRLALFRSLVRGLFINGKIRTTKAKAKAVQPLVDKLITLSKKDTLLSRRLVLSALGNDKDVMNALFVKVAPLFATRDGGYSRIITFPKRLGDKSDMAVIELTEKLVLEKDKKVSKGKTIKTSEVKPAKKEKSEKKEKGK